MPAPLQPVGLPLFGDAPERLAPGEEGPEHPGENQGGSSGRSELLSRMSHELRTPLNAILGFTQLLELEECSPAQRECIHHISRAGQHLLSLINEVLELTRLESGRLTFELEPVLLETLLGQAADHLQPWAQRAQIGMALAEAPVPPGAVCVDRERLKQVLLSLLANAARFVQPGAAIILQSELTAHGRYRLTLTSPGTGVPEEQLTRLFMPLVRDLARGVEGEPPSQSLALSRAIVRAMNGELGLENRPGEGCMFWLELPPADGKQTVPTHPAAEAAPHGAESDQPPDDIDLREE